MVVFALERANSREGGSRLGITATRKIGSAVVRSRSKRRVRELFRLSGVADWSQPLDLVVNVRRSCHDAPWRELERDWARVVAAVADALEGSPRSAGEAKRRVVKWPSRPDAE